MIALTTTSIAWLLFTVILVGWIVYAKANAVRPRLDALIATTKARLIDPAANPIETASDFVQKFIAIHPFPDGNGRTARLMMDRILAEKGLLPPILKNTGNDIGLGGAEFAKEVIHGVSRTNRMLGVSRPIKELRANRLRIVDELLSDVIHDTKKYTNNKIENDHGRLKARSRPMRGLRTERTASVVIQGHAFIQNLRRGHYELGTDSRRNLNLATAFDELAETI